MWKWIKYASAMLLFAWVAAGIRVLGDRLWLEILLGAAVGAGVVYAFDDVGKRQP